MSDVQRYDLMLHPTAGRHMGTSAAGEWVKADDYDALLTERNKQAAALKSILEWTADRKIPPDRKLSLIRNAALQPHHRRPTLPLSMGGAITLLQQAQHLLAHTEQFTSSGDVVPVTQEQRADLAEAIAEYLKTVEAAL